jgi:hypothetical protein
MNKVHFIINSFKFFQIFQNLKCLTKSSFNQQNIINISQIKRKRWITFKQRCTTSQNEERQQC